MALKAHYINTANTSIIHIIIIIVVVVIDLLITININITTVIYYITIRLYKPMEPWMKQLKVARKQ